MGVWWGVVTLIWVSAGGCMAMVFPVPTVEDTTHWHRLGSEDIQDAMMAASLQDWSIAKNVVLFVGDGLGMTPTVAARIFKGQRRDGVAGDEGYLTWERFPNIGLMKTYVLDQQVPDSAATASAYLTGAKANYYTLGVNDKVSRDQCWASQDPNNWHSTIMDWAQQAGKDTGFVTTTRLTHATPAALYAHSANRDWECDSNLGSLGHGCRDIAKQFVEDTPGRDVKVVLAGGRNVMGATPGVHSMWDCVRSDGRNLTQEWLQHKSAHGHHAKYVTTSGQLDAVDLTNTDYLMGLFADSHMEYDVLRDRTPNGQPSLANMTEKAITMLAKNRDNGYFLMVEGGRIDHALHLTQPHRALEDVMAFDDAIAEALRLLDLRETLLLVTADHSHVMTINGYSARGNDILGVSDTVSDMDGMPYTTLMFSNGQSFNYTWNGVNVTRPDVRQQDTTNLDYRPLAGVPTSYETHSAEDVAAYAIGPMSHLLHRVHEQSYLAHVMAFSACIGPYKDKCERPKSHLSRFLPRNKSFKSKTRI